MVPLTALWLPILLAAVGSFMLSSLIHMVLKYHNADYDKLPDEEAFTGFLKSQGVPPGNYFYPHALSAEERKDPAVIEAMTNGPAGSLVVMPGIKMGKNLLHWFILCIVIEIFVAYLGTLALPAGAEYMTVFRFVATAALLGFSGCAAIESIWMGRRWSTTFRHILDGLLFALLSAGVFSWLWP